MPEGVRATEHPDDAGLDRGILVGPEL